MKIKRRGAVEVSDTQVMTNGDTDSSGEQLYRSRDVEDRHIKRFKEKVDQEKLARRSL